MATESAPPAPAERDPVPERAAPRPAGGPTPGSTARAPLWIAVPLGHVARILALLLVFAIVVQLVSSLREVIIWFGTALFLAIALNPAVAFVEVYMRRSFAVLVVFLAFLVGLGGILALVVIPVVNDSDDIVSGVQNQITEVAEHPRFRELNRQYNLAERAQAQAEKIPSVAVGTLGSVVNGVVAAVTILFMALFLLLELPRLGRAVMAQLTPDAARRARDLSVAANRNVGGYVAGNVVISLIAGSTAAVSLWLLDIPYALTLGVVMALLDLVPLVGATVGAAIIVVVAAVTGGVTPGIIILVVLVTYQQVENQILQPLVYRRTVALSPLVVLLAVLAGATLLGVVGALIAIPVAGTVSVVVREILDARAERIAAEHGTAVPPA